MKRLITLFSLAWLALIPATAMAADAAMQKPASTETAIFAGGCFWCMEKPFEQVDGVMSVTSGYIGGRTQHPTYDNYVAGGHIEAVKIVYDPHKVSYNRLLDIYWHQVNPTDAGGQFVDRGHAYITSIFYLNDQQRRQAEASKRAMDASGVFGKAIVTPIVKATTFWPAEAYHQDFYKKNPVRYWFYRSRSGRDDYLDKIWGEDRDGHR